MMILPALRRVACRARSATRHVPYSEQAEAQLHVLRLSRVSRVPPSPFSVFRRSIFIQVMSDRGSRLSRVKITWIRIGLYSLGLLGLGLGRLYINSSMKGWYDDFWILVVDIS